MSTLSQFFSNSGRFRNNRRLWLASGSDTFVVPNGISQILGVVIGGGGSGAAVYNIGSYYGMGGAGGGYAQGVISVTPGQSIAVTIGSNGAATTTYDASGSAGGTSSLGSYLSATGGAGGVYSSSSAPTPGAGSTSGVSEAFTATGGTSGVVTPYSASGGGSSGTPFGTGMSSSNCPTNYQSSAGGSWGCFPQRPNLSNQNYTSEAGHGTSSYGQMALSSATQGPSGGSGGTTQGGAGAIYYPGSYSVTFQSALNGGASPWWFPWEIAGGGGGGVAYYSGSNALSYGGNGGPGGSGAAVTQYYYAQGGCGGFGAGGGAAMGTSTTCRGGDGGNGGGGAGATSQNVSYTRSGAGGAGAVIIYW
jgi:hypothetical protein